jgi:hypothetical protein
MKLLARSKVLVGVTLLLMQFQSTNTLPRCSIRQKLHGRFWPDGWERMFPFLHYQIISKANKSFRSYS